LTNEGYRSDHGGWGFLYLNLLKALGSVYELTISSSPVNFTVAVVSTPENGASFSVGSIIPVEWVTLGGPQDLTWQLNVDGVEVWTGYSLETSIDTSSLDPGSHSITLIAVGATTPFPLEDWSQLVEPQWDAPVPVQFIVNFNLV